MEKAPQQRINWLAWLEDLQSDLTPQERKFVIRQISQQDQFIPEMVHQLTDADLPVLQKLEQKIAELSQKVQSYSRYRIIIKKIILLLAEQNPEIPFTKEQKEAIFSYKKNYSTEMDMYSDVYYEMIDGSSMISSGVSFDELIDDLLIDHPALANKLKDINWDYRRFAVLYREQQSNQKA